MLCLGYQLQTPLSQPLEVKIEKLQCPSDREHPEDFDFSTKVKGITLKLFLNYRVFIAIGKQEGGCSKLTLTLLRAQRASMSPQDWAQTTFRSEIHLNDFNN